MSGETSPLLFAKSGLRAIPLLPFISLTYQTYARFAHNVMDITRPPSSNIALCRPCREILDGKWVKSLFAAGCAPLKVYEFHGNLGSLRECSLHHGCPLCKVVVARGHWHGLDHNTPMTFSTSREEDLMCLEIAPENAYDSSTVCYFSMEKGELVSVLVLEIID